MSTLIRNVGILDARKATPEQISAIGQISNVGSLVLSAANKSELMKVSLFNVGRILELDDDYTMFTGSMEITRQLLEDSAKGVKLCMVGPLTVDSDITPELLQEKLVALYLIGPASVPENLYGAFMSRVKDIAGHVAVEPAGIIKAKGKVVVSNAYLNRLEDATDLSISGNAVIEEDVDIELFSRKIATLRVAGSIQFEEKQEAVLRKALVESDRTRIKIIRLDFHYVPGGTVVDSFSLMTLGKKTISCHGILILHEEVTAELIREKNVRFEAGTIYFPKAVIEEMATRLSPGSKGLPYEPGKFEVISCIQQMTNARLSQMPDKTTLLVMGSLDFADNVDVNLMVEKIAILDNYGEVTAHHELASILQSKLRINEGKVGNKEEEQAEQQEGPGDTVYDTMIENVAVYTF
ncbi:MAG TPA: hypothetical protein PLG20_03555 [Candidatus Syntrophosphaera sp.]|jgi:hypothetical protein|nr:hypothetical protein [Candidatus Syntrophosphaera sp.]